MTCRELIEFLNEYLSGQLPEARQAVFDRHLAICAACVAYLQNYNGAILLGRTAFERLDEDAPDEVPDELVAAILAARSAA